MKSEQANVGTNVKYRVAFPWNNILVIIVIELLHYFLSVVVRVAEMFKQCTHQRDFVFFAVDKFHTEALHPSTSSLAVQPNSSIRCLSSPDIGHSKLPTKISSCSARKW